MVLWFLPRCDLGDGCPRRLPPCSFGIEYGVGLSSYPFTHFWRRPVPPAGPRCEAAVLSLYARPGVVPVLFALTVSDPPPRRRRAAQPKFPALQSRWPARPSAIVLDGVA